MRLIHPAMEVDAHLDFLQLVEWNFQPSQIIEYPVMREQNLVHIRRVNREENSESFADVFVSRRSWRSWRWTRVAPRAESFLLLHPFRQ